MNIINSQRGKLLFRYTNLPSLFDILLNRRLTLLGYQNWKDKNDTKLIDRYLEVSGYASMTALCFTHESETYHHWSTFSGGDFGVRITFFWQKLVDAVDMLPNEENVRFEDVMYRKIREVSESASAIRELPFIKRHPYRYEKEVRIIRPSKESVFENFHISIGLDSIDRISLSPYMPKNLVITTKGLIKSLDGCSKLNIVHSKLIEYDAWINRGLKE